LRRAEADFALLGGRPDEAPAFQAFREQTGALHVPPDDFQQVSPAPAEHEQVARIRILRQHLFRLRGERVEAAPHVRDPGSQPDPRVAGHRDQVISP